MDRQTTPCAFDFHRDRFAYANELVWQYEPDPANGRMIMRRREPRPGYALRCFTLARVARQFVYHARFDPVMPPVDGDACRRLIRGVLGRNPRTPSRAGDRVVIPGYAGLCEFSAAREDLLKAECGGAWRSYVLRSHWRMVLPITRSHQQRTAEELVAALAQDRLPLIHLVTFPALTINHGMLVFDAMERAGGREFLAYDPNNPSEPARLIYDGARRLFSMPASPYWAGGELKIIQICRTWWL